MLYTYKRPEYITKVPQCETMTDKYYQNIDLKNYAPLGNRGVETLRLGKINYQPFADAFLMHYHTKRTDYITSIRMTNLTWLVSPSFADFLQTFNLPEYQVFDAVVEHRSKRHPYKILYFCYENREAIDYIKTSMYVSDKGISPKVYEKITISSVEMFNEQMALLTDNRVIKSKKLFFRKNIEIDIIKLIFPYVGLFISEHLKTAIQAAGFTGIDFAEVPNPLIQHLVWADTGLPVED